MAMRGDSRVVGRGLRDDAAGLVSRRRGVVVVELPRRARRRGVEQVVDVPDQRDRRRRRRVRARRLLCVLGLDRVELGNR